MADSGRFPVENPHFRTDAGLHAAPLGSPHNPGSANWTGLGAAREIDGREAR